MANGLTLANELLSDYSWRGVTTQLENRQLPRIDRDKGQIQPGFQFFSRALACLRGRVSSYGVGFSMRRI